MRLRILNEIDLKTIGILGAGATALGYGGKKLYNYYKIKKKIDNNDDDIKLKDISEKDLSPKKIESMFNYNEESFDIKDNISSETQNASDIKIKDIKKPSKILNLLGKYYKSFMDGLSVSIPGIGGFGLDIFSGRRLKKNEIASSKLTNLFSNTKFAIYEYDSNILNAFSFAAINENMSLINNATNTIVNIFTNKYISPFIPESFMSIIFYLNDILCYLNRDSRTIKELLNIFNNGKNYTLKFDPIQKKINMDCEYVTAYISSGMFNVLNEDEIIAVLLHETGHNINIFNQIFADMAKKYFINNPYTTIYASANIFSLLDMLKEKSNEINGANTYDIYYQIIQICICFFIIQYIIFYFQRREEYKADEFAVKCGYGESLKNALIKMKNFDLSFQFKNKNFNFFDKICHVCRMIFVILGEILGKLHIASHPATSDRVKMIDNTLKTYDTSDKNIDRTKSTLPIITL